MPMEHQTPNMWAVYYQANQTWNYVVKQNLEGYEQLIQVLQGKVVK